MTKSVTVPEYNRAVNITIYDLQGGPFPEEAVKEIESTLERVANTYKGLAISVVRD